MNPKNRARSIGSIGGATFMIHASLVDVGVSPRSPVVAGELPSGDDRRRLALAWPSGSTAGKTL